LRAPTIRCFTVGPSEIFPAKSNSPPTRQNPWSFQDSIRSIIDVHRRIFGRGITSNVQRRSELVTGALCSDVSKKMISDSCSVRKYYRREVIPKHGIRSLFGIRSRWNVHRSIIGNGILSTQYTCISGIGGDVVCVLWWSGVRAQEVEKLP